MNLHLSWAVGPQGFYYAPDPSSQQACTIGGNIANNSGGPHTLKYGVTTNHVLGLEVVLPDGELMWLGGKTRDAQGYDLVGLFVGSEGTFGIATKIVVRILKKPQAVKTVLAVFDQVDQASEAVSAIIARGLVPAAMEMIDQLTIEAVEDAFGCGYPRDAAAALLIELDGLAAGMEAQAERVVAGLPRLRRARRARRARRGGAPAALEGPQVRVRRLRPHLARLHGDGRRDPAHQAALRARARERDRGRPRPARRQRVPRGRRQPAPEHPLRSAQAGRGGAGGGGGRRRS